MPCNVLTIDSEHKKRVDQTQGIRGGDGGAGGEEVVGGVTRTKIHHLWDNRKMGRGRFAGIEERGDKGSHHMDQL